MDANGQDPRYLRAKQRVEELKGFYAHLAVYVVVIAGLFLINRATDGGGWWFYWPAIGWGVGLVIHAVFVFAIEGTRGQAWEERKIRQLMEHDRGAGQA